MSWNYLQNVFASASFVYVHDENIRKPQVHIPCNYVGFFSDRIYHMVLDRDVREKYVNELLRDDDSDDDDG